MGRKERTQKPGRNQRRCKGAEERGVVLWGEDAKIRGGALERGGGA